MTGPVTDPPPDDPKQPRSREQLYAALLDEHFQVMRSSFAHLAGEYARYGAALRRIASADSGIWGQIADEALRESDSKPPE